MRTRTITILLGLLSFLALAAAHAQTSCPETVGKQLTFEDGLHHSDFPSYRTARL